MGIIANYKKRSYNNFVAKYIQRLFFNTYYKIMTAVVLAIVGGYGLSVTNEFSTINTVFYVMFYIGAITLGIVLSVAMAYAWIINPIVGLVKKIKKNGESDISNS